MVSLSVLSPLIVIVSPNARRIHFRANEVGMVIRDLPVIDKCIFAGISNTIHPHKRPIARHQYVAALQKSSRNPSFATHPKRMFRRSSQNLITGMNVQNPSNSYIYLLHFLQLDRPIRIELVLRPQQIADGYRVRSLASGFHIEQHLAAKARTSKLRNIPRDAQQVERRSDVVALLDIFVRVYNAVGSLKDLQPAIRSLHAADEGARIGETEADIDDRPRDLANRSGS